MKQIFTHEKSMVGRAFDAQGNDIGDSKFFERDMGFSREAEAAALDEIRNEEIKLALVQVEALASQDRNLGAKAYAQLIQMYEQDARASDWRKRMEELAS